MKQLKLLFTILFLLNIPFAVYSQKKSKQDRKEFKLPSECFYTKFNSLTNANTFELPFGKIVLSDNRFDTTKFGYIYESKWDKDYKLCLKTNFKDEATTLLNNYFSPNFSKTDNIVFACIKNISNRLIIPELEQAGRYKKRREYNFYLKIEFYLKKQSGYYPLYRFDSTIIYSWDSEKELSEQITSALIISTQKLSSQSTYKIENSKTLSYEQIDSFNNVAKNIPLLKQEAAQRGLYLTFEQLKENEPAYTDFEISLSETADLLYVKGKNLKDSVISDSWGFSDGKTMFIRQGYNFFPLYKIGNNFEFYGYHNILTGSQPFPFSPTSGNTTMQGTAIELGVKGIMSLIRVSNKDLQPYLLDMESGKIYQSFSIFL